MWPKIDIRQSSKIHRSYNLVAFLEVESDTRDIKEVSHLASTVIKERMQSIPGIQRVQIVGEHKYAMRLRLDPIKLASYQLTPEDIRVALARENMDLPSGRIEAPGAGST